MRPMQRPMHPTRRRRKLIQPALQIRLVGSFVGLAGGALLLQFLLLGWRLSSLAASLDGMGGELAAELPGLMLQALVFSGAVLLPLIFLVGIVLTHPIAGPAYRFEQHLRAIARGEDPGPCRIRKRDQLQDLCRWLNAALETLQRRAPGAPAPGEGAAAEAAEPQARPELHEAA